MNKTVPGRAIEEDLVLGPGPQAGGGDDGGRYSRKHSICLGFRCYETSVVLVVVSDEQIEKLTSIGIACSPKFGCPLERRAPSHSTVRDPTSRRSFSLQIHCCNLVRGSRHSSLHRLSCGVWWVGGPAKRIPIRKATDQMMADCHGWRQGQVVCFP
jgi:hypothetical protein